MNLPPALPSPPVSEPDRPEPATGPGDVHPTGEDIEVAPPPWWDDHDLPGSPDPFPFLGLPDQDHGPAPEEAPIHLVDPDGGSRRPAWWPVLTAAVLASLLTLGGLALAGVFDDGQPAVEAGQPPLLEVREIVTRGTDGTTAGAVGRKVTPSIVSIEIGSMTGEDFRQFGVGSGVVLSNDGLIVTNHHVIDGSESIHVVLQDGTFYAAEVVGSDEETDLAVLRVGARHLVPIEVGTSEDLVIGDVAIAVGNPLGLRGGASLTVGVLSALDRQVQATGAPTLYGMLQTDAPITQGSSGGALVDENGRLVGITTAIGVSTAGAEGIGFAIPVELMRRITDEIIAEGSARHAFLGVQLRNHFDEGPDGATIPAGALVDALAGAATSAAAQAGVVAGDVIVGIEGRAIASPEELKTALRRMRVGDVVRLDVRRGDDVLGLDVVLGEESSDQ